MNNNQGFALVNLPICHVQTYEAFEGAFGAVGQMHGDGVRGKGASSHADMTLAAVSGIETAEGQCKDLFDSSLLNSWESMQSCTKTANDHEVEHRNAPPVESASSTGKWITS